MLKKSAPTFTGLFVTPRANEPVDNMIKRFVKKVKTSGILDEAWERSYYEKPSVKRRRKHQAAMWKNQQTEE